MNPDKQAEEFWHMDPDGEACGGPYASIEAAQADAELILHDRRYHIPEIKIVKTVAQSSTKVSFDTTWEPK